MARKKYEEEHENHERWLVSYADFITLLFAFFVVMYAISSVNEGKYRILANSLGSAFGQSAPVFVEDTPQPAPLRTKQVSPQPQRVSEAVRREREYMTSVARELLKTLAPLVSEGKVRVTQNSRGVSLEINASVLFAPGDAKLTAESSQALKAVAQILKTAPNAMQVEGYSDNVPIKTAFFPSNWELSAVRASSVVRLFIENGIAENRLTAVGYGPNRPVGENDTAEGRARNRRVTITILSALPDTVIEVLTEVPPQK